MTTVAEPIVGATPPVSVTLSNPGAEGPTPGWVGALIVDAPLAPHGGSFYYQQQTAATPGVTTEIKQEIDLVAAGVSEAQLDTGEALIQMSLYTAALSASATASITLRLMNSGHAPVKEVTLPYKVRPPEWQLESVAAVAPVGTRFAQLIIGSDYTSTPGPLPFFWDDVTLTVGVAPSVWKTSHTRTTIPRFKDVPMCFGVPRRRRVHRTVPSTVGLTRELTFAQAQQWRDWWRDEALLGQNQFQAVIQNLGRDLSVVALMARSQPKIQAIDGGSNWSVEIEATVMEVFGTVRAEVGNIGDEPPRVLSRLSFAGLPIVDDLSHHNIRLSGFPLNGSLSTDVVVPGALNSFKNHGTGYSYDYASPTVRARSNANLDPIDPVLGANALTMESFVYMPSTGGPLTNGGFEFDGRICDLEYEELYFAWALDFTDAGDSVTMEIEGISSGGDAIITGYYTDTVGLTLPRDAWIHTALVVTLGRAVVYVNGVNVLEMAMPTVRDRGIIECSFVRMQVNPEKRDGSRPMYQGPAQMLSGAKYTTNFTPPTTAAF